MSDGQPAEPVSDSEPTTRQSLAQLAQLLREVEHLDPQVRDKLADLVDELAATLHGEIPLARASHLAESAAQLVRALHDRRDEGPIALARDHLEEAVARAEVDAPVATGVARRLIDLLAELGI